MNGNEKTRAIGGLLARLTLAGVFIYSGLVKLMAPPEEFAYAIETYRILNSQLSLWAAYAVPWVELYAGLLLAAGVYTRVMAAFHIVMLAGFELLLAQAWLRGLPITSCGCFGAKGSNSLSQEFIMNIGLLCLAYAAFRYGGDYSADKAVEKRAA
ncbi:MAG: DoxX family protein [Elusimicrobiales bacterium]|nr:DoxX family protein [Elusimicrobiales bacterium]